MDERSPFFSLSQQCFLFNFVLALPCLSYIIQYLAEPFSSGLSCSFVPLNFNTTIHLNSFVYLFFLCMQPIVVISFLDLFPNSEFLKNFISYSVPWFSQNNFQNFIVIRWSLHLFLFVRVYVPALTCCLPPDMHGHSVAHAVHVDARVCCFIILSGFV